MISGPYLVYLHLATGHFCEPTILLGLTQPEDIQLSILEVNTIKIATTSYIVPCSFSCYITFNELFPLCKLPMFVEHLYIFQTNKTCMKKVLGGIF